jgi:hypothetical protein
MTKDNSTEKSEDDSGIDDADELFESTEIPAAIPDSEPSSISRDARRKIEIYWEKKRLREQFDDFDESEFGF